MEQENLLYCYNKGCGIKFDPNENSNGKDLLFSSCFMFYTSCFMIISPLHIVSTHFLFSVSLPLLIATLAFHLLRIHMTYCMTLKIRMTYCMEQKCKYHVMQALFPNYILQQSVLLPPYCFKSKHVRFDQNPVPKHS